MYWFIFINWLQYKFQGCNPRLLLSIQSGGLALNSFYEMSPRIQSNYLWQNITVHIHSKSNLILGIAGYYTSSILTLRKGDTFIIKGPFTFWNSPIWDFGGKDVFWQFFFFLGGGGVGKMKPGLQISLQTLILNVMVWKIETGVLAFWGLSFQHKGFLGVLIIVPIEKSLFTSFFLPFQ